MKLPINTKKIALIGSAIILITVVSYFVIINILVKKNHYVTSVKSTKPPSAKRIDAVKTSPAQVVPVAGTITPADLAANQKQYIGKEVKVRGTLGRLSPTVYVISEQAADRPTAFKLYSDDSSIDFSKYLVAEKGADGNYHAKPVTVTAVLKTDARSPKSVLYRLTVSSISF